MRTLLGSLGILASAISPVGANASGQAILERCKNEMTAPVMLPSQVLREEYGIDINNACPEQSSKDTEHRNCDRAAKDLEKAAETWLKAHKESCKLKQAYADLESSGQQCTGAANNCSGKAAALQQQARDQNQKELSALQAMKARVQELKKFALEIAQGAVNIQSEAERDYQANPRGANGKNNRFLKTPNNQKAYEYFARTGQTVQAGQQIIDALRGSDVSSGSGNQRPQSPLLREPIDLATAANRLESDFSVRERELLANKSELTRQVTTNTNKESSLSSLGNNASSLGQAASAAGAAGGAGGGNAGSLGGDTSSPYAQTDPGYSNNTNAMNEKVTTVVQDADGTERYAQVPRSALPGYSALAKSSAAAAAPSSAVGIKNLEAAVGTSPTGEAAATNKSGSSRAAPSSNLRNALRARLAGASAASADAAVGGGGGSPVGELPKVNVVAPAGGGTAGAHGEALATATGSGDLGAVDFSLAGSETDSLVQGMVSQFSDDLGLAGHRGLASVAQGAPEILEQNSASLFTRTRATHERSLKRGLLINGLRSKL